MYGLEIHIHITLNFKGHHVGDLGNIMSDKNGDATIDMELIYADRPTLYCGRDSIIGRAIVIYESTACIKL